MSSSRSSRIAHSEGVGAAGGESEPANCQRAGIRACARRYGCAGANRQCLTACRGDGAKAIQCRAISKAVSGGFGCEVERCPGGNGNGGGRGQTSCGSQRQGTAVDIHTR